VPCRHLPRRAQQRILLLDLPRHPPHEPAFAQAAGAEHHAAHGRHPQQPAQHHRGKRQIVDTPARRAWQPFQHPARRGGDQAGQLARFLAADRVMVHHLQRIVCLGHVYARQGPPRPADEIEIAAGRVFKPRHRLQIRFSDHARAYGIAVGAFRQPDYAQLQRLRRSTGPGHQPHHLQRTAADIRQHPVRRRNAAQHPVGRIGGFLDTGQDVDRHVRHSLPQRCHEGWAVIGVAHRRGGQHLERLGTHRTGHRVITMHHRQREAHSLIIEPAGGFHSAAQPQHRLLVEDRDRIAGVALVHHQPDGIGPEIDDTAAR
jgi:hypothetical protein